MSGADLQARRQALGLSQAQLAQALALSVRTLQNWEAGYRRVPFPRMLDLALDMLELRQKASEERPESA